MTAPEPKMAAPLHRSVCQLTGAVSPPSKFWDANERSNERLADAAAQLAELEALRVENADLKSKTPESKVLSHGIARLVETYLHHAADDDQRTHLINLANMLRHSTALCAAQGNEIAHYESEASAEWWRANDLQEKFDAAEADLTDARERIQELESALAQAVSDRDTARLGGGAR